MNTLPDKPSERYLSAGMLFADKALAAQKQECIAFCRSRPKEEPAYGRYISWQKSNNEVAVFTMYAYAALILPYAFDIVFLQDNPDVFIQTPHILTQGIWEGWSPVNSLERGHKHIYSQFIKYC